VPPRFYAPDVKAERQVVSLPPEEASHFTRVLRGTIGDAIRVFDGRGHEFAAIVREAHRLVVTVETGEPIVPAPERRARLTLAQAILKGDKMDDVVRDAVMMGVVAIQPIVSSRTEVALAAVERGRRRERWARIAVASTKQCGRAVVPEVLPAISFDTLAAGLDGTALRRVLQFVEPGTHRDVVRLAAVPRPDQGDETTLLIGPEGGWTEAEVERGATSWRRVTMRGSTLRADAMPIVSIAALLAAWGEL
jgi:16S rRNA (uracil1498-N3)-methyltransferase